MKLVTTLIILLLPMSIITTSVTIYSTNYDFYLEIFREQGIYTNFKSPDELEFPTKNIIDFFNNKNVLDQKYYSQQAILHLQDVKKLLFQVKFTAALSCIAQLLLIAYVLYIKKATRLITAYMLGSAATALTVFVIFIAISFNFAKLFLVFHQTIFNNNYWLFGEGDSLIKIFPQKFFVAFASYIVEYTLAAALVIFLFTLCLNKINGKPRV